MQRFLFDRLCDPLRVMPKDSHGKLLELRESITQALQRLFTHRSFFEGLSTSALNHSTGFDSVLNFGLKDLMSSGATVEDISRYKRHICRMIQMYEPRLNCPDFVLKKSNDPLSPATLYVTGQIKADELEDEFLWRPVINDERSES